MVTLPTQVEAVVKFHVYTLACDALLRRLAELRVATAGDARLSVAACINRFDGALARFFNDTRPKNERDAAKRLAAELTTVAGNLHDLNSDAGAMFDNVVSSMLAQVGEWDSRQAIDHAHERGRVIAESYFATSTWAESRNRLTRGPCEVRVEFEEGPRGPASYCPVNGLAGLSQRQTEAIIIRFGYSATASHGFWDYLAYVYYFLHEYTAHIFSLDHGNEVFNDGWMLFVADSLLRLQWAKFQAGEPLPYAFDLDRDQCWIFPTRLLTPLKDTIYADAYFSAQQFDATLLKVQPGRFDEIILELAAFQPIDELRESHMLPTDFIYKIARALGPDAASLRKKILKSRDVRSLLALL